jgi:tetratricopeptide (TPR) repeat protein
MQAVTSWGALAIGTIGVVVAIIVLVRNHKTEKRAQRIESNRLLTKAWNILGGQTGATWIFGEKNVANRLEEARGLINEALSRDPGYPKAHMYYGVYLQFMGKYEEAVDSHRKAIKLDTTYSSAYNNLGKTYIQLEDLEAAIENFRLALKYDENFAYAQYNLGVALLAKGDTQKAINELERVTQERHCPPEVHSQLSEAYRMIGLASQAEVESAIAHKLRLENEKARSDLLNRGSSP